MYQLYYYPLNASMAPHFMLEELNVEFELIKVDRKNNAQKSKDYLALNPAGRIPTLIDNGQAIFESPAICIHLAESNPQANLIPAIGSPNRALFFQWMMYLTNTVQAELMIYFYPQKHSADETNIAGMVAVQEKRITEMLALLDNELEGKDYLVGDSISACDFFLFMLAVWADEFKKPPLAYTHLSRYLRKLAQRESIIQVCKKEGLSLADYQ
ncbi:glutathione S-transferase family protein [Litorilituus sediminis]|uniref:Glutathione S-transferase family protein n=1 Tax=Litorilituus sediminis TaxID=718192 RepID=A0A4P6P2C6_9GAMM|nr:glutathione S-transferase family protein [Litorilituus sediminis]QBG35401.1 glutathione S-transferase family protein [Litorilituus sediminis]